MPSHIASPASFRPNGKKGRPGAGRPFFEHHGRGEIGRQNVCGWSPSVWAPRYSIAVLAPSGCMNEPARASR